MKVPTNCYIDHAIKEKGKKFCVDFSECLTFGILFKVAETNYYGYPHNKLSEKIEKLSERLSEALLRIEELEDDT